MKAENIWRGWNLFRWIRLVLGIYVAIEGIRSEGWGFIVFGLLFALMALFNIGCCSGNCDIVTRNDRKDSWSDDVLYEEMETKKNK